MPNSEADLIKAIAPYITSNSSVVLPIGDDSAGIKIPKKNKNDLLLITTDTFVEDVDFKLNNPMDDFFYALGKKIFAANVSDIAAMGGAPSYALINLLLPPKTTTAQITSLYKGFNSFAPQVAIVGGDISRSQILVISITMVGFVEPKNVLKRSTAKIGDVIAVTGEFGGPLVSQYDPTRYNYESRVDDARLLAKSRVCSAMIDSSDGLAESVWQISIASNVGALLYEVSIPKPRGTITKDALYSGEEFELVFTIPPKKLNRLPKNIKSTITIVGQIVSEREGIMLKKVLGEIVPIERGWDHLNQEAKSS